MCAVLTVYGLVPPLPCNAQDAAAGPEASTVVSSLAGLEASVYSDQPCNLKVDLAGTVLWASDAEGRIILHDSTATVQLELNLPCTLPDLGEQLHLEGEAAAIKARDAIVLSSVPVVENNGLHGFTEKTGKIYLEAGRHPVQVAWFNRTDRFGLEVEYAGPGTPRQNIPDNNLYRMVVETPVGRTNYVNGLSYYSYEGQWWRLLPNFDHVAPVGTGVVENFDIGVRSRDSHVGVQFSGLIDVPQEGEYTFYLRSDDGSRLFVGPSTLKLRSAGSTALPTPSRASDRDFRWSEIEGDITAVHQSLNTLELELLTGVGLVRVKIAEDSSGSYVLRPHNRIRAVGVSRRIRRLDGNWVRGEFYVQHWDDIEQHYVSPTIWTDYPVMQIDNLVRHSDRYDHSVVHLRGRIISDRADGQLMLDDGSGRIVLIEDIPEEYRNGLLDLLGIVSRQEFGLSLTRTFYRMAGSEDQNAADLPLLTTIEQIYQLSHEESARRYPVKVRGVITSPRESDGAVFQDASRGIYVSLGGPINLQIGDFCEIEGFTGPYEFSQYIEASEVTVLGTGTLPEPTEPSWDQLINGSLHCNYVELEGVLTSIEGDTITLLTRGGRINVRLNPAGPAMTREALGATVRLRGCLLADWDMESKRVVVGSIYLDQHWMTVVHPAPIDPFSVGLKRVGDLLQFDPQASALQRIKVSGILVHKSREICCLMDGENGLSFIPIHTYDGVPGDTLEVVGFLELGGPSPVLREAVGRKTGSARLPEPRRLEPGNLLRNEHDSAYVRVEGVLLGISEQQDKVLLELQSGLRRFVAELNGRYESKNMTPGSRLELTGTYIGLGGDRVLGRPIDSFKLLLNSSADITILSRPPWWTLERMLSVMGLLAAVLVVAMVWIKLLRRKVEERTEELADQIRERQRAERQREVEQERARLAHDLHDDLGAHLTEVNMLSSLIGRPDTSAEERRNYSDQLSDIAMHMVTSLDEIVWAVNPRNDTVSSLAAYFGAYAQRLLELASITCGLDVSDELPDLPLEPRFRQEMFMAFKESLNNVIQHANAAKVWLRIFTRGKSLVVIVSDDGTGIVSNDRKPGADGLANMTERMKVLGGQCSIHSDQENGTIVSLEAPIRRVWE